MLRQHYAALLLTFATPLMADSQGDKFQQDRAAILAMAGEFKVSFDFKEVVSLQPGYELHKPHHSEAKELVKVVEDNGEQITLQHLLVISDLDGPRVIKHWAQIWTYEDSSRFDYEGNMTWLPVALSEEEREGTWTQYVTQVDDSPRYKAAGKWLHEGNYSSWTSFPSTRPLPRREYTTRSDYDLIKTINRHLITPTGWVHTQDNRKYVRRNGANHSICLEEGLNTYTRITEHSDTDQEDFAAAEKYWEKTHPFWAEVRAAWAEILSAGDGPIHYRTRVTEDKKKNLMARMSELAELYKEDPNKATRAEVNTLLSEHLSS